MTGQTKIGPRPHLGWSGADLAGVAGEGFEPSKAKPTDLQSAPIGRSGNPPGVGRTCRPQARIQHRDAGGRSGIGR